MITYCANSILYRAYEGDGLPPVVSESWARRFLKRHPEYLTRKQSDQESNRMNIQEHHVILEWLPELKRIRPLPQAPLPTAPSTQSSQLFHPHSVT